MITIPGYKYIKKLGEGGAKIAFLSNKDYCAEPRVIKIFKLDHVKPVVGGIGQNLI